LKAKIPWLRVFVAGVVQAFDTITVVSENLSVAAERFEAGGLRSIDREH
jgi:hypothetical protein